MVGRFLEHSRIYSFHRGDEHVYYIGSADLMPRNLDTRVELLTPVEDPELHAELEDTLERCLADDTFAWTLDSDGVVDPAHGPHPQRASRADGAHAGAGVDRRRFLVARCPLTRRRAAGLSAHGAPLRSSGGGLRGAAALSLLALARGAGGLGAQGELDGLVCRRG